MHHLSLARLHVSHARNYILGVVCALTFTACRDASAPASTSRQDDAASQPAFTLASGSTSTLLGRANFSDPSNPVLSVSRTAGNWHLQIQANHGFDLAVQTITFQPGGQSGWHSHPGPVFIQVVSGTMTFYESTDPTCTPIVRTAGQGFLDYGAHAHMARNETGTVAQNVVTYFAPPGAALRIDEPSPGNCAF